MRSEKFYRRLKEPSFNSFRRERKKITVTSPSDRSNNRVKKRSWDYDRFFKKIMTAAIDKKNEMHGKIQLDNS